MMSDLNIAERLSVNADEMAALKNRRVETLAEIGEKALPELRERPEFAQLAARADELLQQAETLRQQEAALKEEKERLEKEEKERIAKLTCFKCRAVSPEGSKFCEECGAQLGVPPREYCNACGTMNQPGLKFCGECGAKLGEAAAP